MRWLRAHSTGSVAPHSEPVCWRDVCPLAELAEAVPRAVEIAGIEVCLVRLGEEVLAVRDECTHESVALSDGDVEGGAIECWRHGSRFDLRTGAVLNPPAVDPVQTYPVRIAGQQVQIDVGT